MLLIPGVLWVGGVGALSTALIALLKPRPGQAWQSYVIAGLLATAGLTALGAMADRIGARSPSAQAQTIADAVTLRALAVDGHAAAATFSMARPTRLRHLTLRSLDGYCEGTEWPDEAPLSGAHTLRVSLRCAGGVAVARSWRLSTVAEQDGSTATLVWSDAPETSPSAIVRPLP